MLTYQFMPDRLKFLIQLPEINNEMGQKIK